MPGFTIVKAIAQGDFAPEFAIKNGLILPSSQPLEEVAIIQLVKSRTMHT